MKVLIALFALAAVACAAPSNPAPYRPAPTYAPAPSYKQEPANYQYQYSVVDEYAGVNMNAEEAQNGYATNGAYQVLLPDGRTQTVTYTVADDYSGYVADVQYTGTPTYGPAPVRVVKPHA